jgi:hypothetical protein
MSMHNSDCLTLTIILRAGGAEQTEESQLLQWSTQEVCFIFCEKGRANQEKVLWKTVTHDMETASHLNQTKQSYLFS